MNAQSKSEKETTNPWRILSVILGVLVTAPIWYYLLYKILKTINASELMMFLFWVYVPVAMLTNLITKLTEKK